MSLGRRRLTLRRLVGILCVAVMNYLLENEVKPIAEMDRSLSLHQRFQSLRYRSLGFPGQAQASVRPASLDFRFGNSPQQAAPLAGASLGQALGRLEVRPFTDVGRPEIMVARREVAYGVSPFPSALDELR